MRPRMSALAVRCGIFLVPLLTFATPGHDCIKHPNNPNCPVVAMPEHWGTLESLGFCALLLIVFWVIIRLNVLQLGSKT
jgi:hypothetical protein